MRFQFNKGNRTWPAYKKKKKRDLSRSADSPALTSSKTRDIDIKNESDLALTLETAQSDG